MQQIEIIRSDGRQITSWQENLTFTDGSGRQFDGTLYWNEHDGVQWHGDELPSTSDLDAFLYALDEAATDIKLSDAPNDD